MYVEAYLSHRLHVLVNYRATYMGCVISCCVILLFKPTCLQTTLNPNFHLCNALSILSRLLIWHTRKQAWQYQESSDSQLIRSLVLSDPLWFYPGIVLSWKVWFDETLLLQCWWWHVAPCGVFWPCYKHVTVVCDRWENNAAIVATVNVEFRYYVVGNDRSQPLLRRIRCSGHRGEYDQISTINVVLPIIKLDLECWKLEHENQCVILGCLL